jgi:dTDP-4-amino-4,6-dideoxygalactose transaminase
LEEQTRRRTENATLLSALLREVPGVLPARAYDGCTRNAYHLFMFRYQRGAFAGLPRGTFLKALAAEGVPASGGYRPLHREPFVLEALQGRGYQRLFSRERLAHWGERNTCPRTDQLSDEAVWLTQNLLLGTRRDMEQVAEAVRKVHRHAADLARA